jgi:hypothetical protein
MNIIDKDHFIDKLVASIEEKEEEFIWGDLWQKASIEITETMSNEHIDIILREDQKIRDGLKSFRHDKLNNLYEIFVKMIFFHCLYKMNVPDRKCPLFLPPHVAQAYIDNNDRSPIDICQSCGYIIFGFHFNSQCPYCKFLK